MLKHRSNQPRSRLNDSRRMPSVSRNDRPASYSYHQNRASENGRTDRGKNANEASRLPTNPNRLKLKAVLVLVLIALLLELPVTAPAKIIVQSPASAAAKFPVEQYKAASEHVLASSPLSHTKLTLNQAGLAARLEKQFPEVKSASVSYSPFSYHPTIKLTMSPPKLALATANGEFLIDASGDVVGRSPKNTNLPLVIDKSNLAPKPGQPILPGDYVSFIDQVLAQLQANGVRASKSTLPAESSELDIQPKGENYFVKFNLQGDSREQAGTYIAAKHYLEKNNITVKRYVDARVPGRVYYQ